MKYDDVMNDQRKAIFAQRREIMESADLGEVIEDMRHQVVEDLVAEHIPARAYADQWDVDGLAEKVSQTFNLALPIAAWADEEGVDDEVIRERLTAETDAKMAEKLARYGAETMRAIEKQVLLQTIDQNWREHLMTLEHLRSVVGFRGYAQRDPLNEYKSEGFQLFESLLNKLRSEVTRMLAHVQVMTAEEQQAMIAQMQARAQAAQAEAMAAATASEAAFNAPAREPAMATMGAGAGPAPAPPGGAGSGQRRRRGRRDRPGRRGDLVPQRPQRPLPLRLGQKIQTLPRPGVACRADLGPPVAGST